MMPAHRIFIDLTEATLKGKPVIDMDVVPVSGTCMRHDRDAGVDDILATHGVVRVTKTVRHTTYLCEQCYQEYLEWLDEGTKCGWQYKGFLLARSRLQPGKANVV